MELIGDSGNCKTHLEAIIYLLNFAVHQIKMDPIIPNHRGHLLKAFASFIWNGLLEWKSNSMRTLIFSYGCTPYCIKQFEFLKSSCFTETNIDCCDYPCLGKLLPRGSWGFHRLPSACWWACWWATWGAPAQETASWGRRRSLGTNSAIGILWFPFPCPPFWHCHPEAQVVNSLSPLLPEDSGLLVPPPHPPHSLVACLRWWLGW